MQKRKIDISRLISNSPAEVGAAAAAAAAVSPESPVKSTRIKPIIITKKNSTIKSSSILNDDISEIIPGFLYLSNAITAKNIDVLNRENITHQLCVTNNEETSNAIKERGRENLIISIPDHSDIKISNYFEEAINFIMQAKAENGVVLVNCERGISRSATIVAAYLISQEVDLIEAHEVTPSTGGGDFLNDGNLVSKCMSFLQSKRNCVDPNLGFVMCLNEFAEHNTRYFPRPNFG